MLEPLSEHTLLLFWVQLVVLLGVARGLGLVAQRIGQPAVVGELSAGLLIGPSILGRLAPDTAAWLFPGGAVDSAPILALAWLGVALLLVQTGYETDLKLLSHLGRQAFWVSSGSLAVPLLLGLALGVVMPDMLQGDAGRGLVFAAFVAVAMSISALPVVARILTELDLMRRNLGQVTVAAAMTNDLVGWVLLGTLSGIVVSGGFEVRDTLLTVVAVAILFVGALTVGQRLVDALLRWALGSGEPGLAAFSAAMFSVFSLAALTQAIGIEAVLGAFVAGILLGRSRYRPRDVEHTVELVSSGMLAPIFFATAGTFVDLGTLAQPGVAGWGLAVLAVALVSKLAGSFIGGRIGGMASAHSLAIGIGLNARGAMEIVLATIALSLGVFNQASYTIIVLMAMVTSIMAPPGLRWALRNVRPEGAEAERLERERLLSASVVANTAKALVPTRGGESSRVAARVLDLTLKSDARVTVLTVHLPQVPESECGCDEALREVGAVFHDRRVEHRRHTGNGDPAAAILQEASLDYGLIALGMTEEFRDTHELSQTLRRVLAGTRIPVLLVRHAQGSRPDGFNRILVPAVGTRAGRAAEEVAFTMAARLGCDLDLVHVVARADRDHARPRLLPWHLGRRSFADDAAEGVLAASDARARRFGAIATSHVRHGPSAASGLLEAAGALHSDVLVLSTHVRTVAGEPFFGHGAETVLEHAEQTIILVLFPGDDRDDHP